MNREEASVLFHFMNQGRDLANERNSRGQWWYLSLGPDAEEEFYQSHKDS